jgi:hypothetical protein
MATTRAAGKTAGRKSAAKRATNGATKAAARPAAKAAGKRAAAKPAAAKGAAGGRPAAKQPAAKRAAAKTAGNYTDPALRERLKAEIIAGTKGGRAGQWSARKAQLLAHAYEAHGGGYTGAKTGSQRHLDEWTHEEWQTADGKPARRGGTTARYLPKKAWEELTPAERRATDKKKRAASKTGRQFVANTGRAADARRDATAHDGAPAKRSNAKRPAAKGSAAKRPSAKRAGAKRPAAKRAAGPGATERGAAKRASPKRAGRG